ncbi:hypothetical protein POM88_017707 [Heracleum sosnowskyi]|uniref:RNase H type-1 domain-containing protein n=1 Tax=Heracleum sosnowskyi TaxID=360622 RepID=A0AAD8IP38_9APIA|nr:hypothetical protein POM88_017707 [Heracleum sosnowskyi]
MIVKENNESTNKKKKRRMLERDLIASDIDFVVADYWIEGQGWDRSRLTSILPNVYFVKLASLIIKESPDEFFWRHDFNGKFSCKSAYRGLMELKNSVFEKAKWSKIWKCKTQYRINVFLWILEKNRILINSRKFRMGIIPSPLCYLCENHEETQLHALRDCSWAAAVWKFFISPRYIDVFFNLNSNDWVQWNLKTSAGSARWTSSWSSAFADIVHSIWLVHNEVIHNPEIALPNDPVKHICSRIVGANNSTIPIDKLRSVISIKLQNMYIGVGGLAQDDCTENWIKGFTGCIGKASPLATELWTIYHGLELARDLRAQNIILESDSLDTVNCILYPDSSHPHFDIISQIFKIRKPWYLHICHVLREANYCADFLAHHSSYSSNLNSRRTS